MAPKQPTTTTQISKVELPKWVDEAAQSNYKLAEQIANKPYNPYTGQTVAGTSQTTQDAYDLFKNTLGAGSEALTGAGNMFAKQGAGLAGLNRDDYMNPFINEVESKALGALDESRVKSLMGNADKAIAANAFGGSRAAIVDAVTNAEAAKSAGQLSAGLRSEGYDKATAAMLADLQAAGSAGQGLLSQSQAEMDKRNKDFAGLLGIGQQQQGQTQRELDDAKGRFDEKEGYDLERLNILLSSLGMSPYGKTENTQKTTQGGGGTDFAQMGLGILSLLGGLFGISDKTLKTDIEKVGDSTIADVPIYSYRFKGAPKKSKKIVGPMAQDVERVKPDAVITIGGKKAVRKDILGVLSDPKYIGEK